MLTSIVFSIDCYQVHYITHLILGISHSIAGIATSIVAISDHTGIVSVSDMRLLVRGTSHSSSVSIHLPPFCTPQSRHSAIVTEEWSEEGLESTGGHGLCLLKAESPPESYSHRDSSSLLPSENNHFLSSLFQNRDTSLHKNK